MYELDATTIVVSLVVTWSIGLLPPVIIRYAILKRPIAKWPAIGICALFWVINFSLFRAMGSKPSLVLWLITLVSYWILRKGSNDFHGHGWFGRDNKPHAKPGVAPEE
jgi:hypothetical protein